MHSPISLSKSKKRKRLESDGNASNYSSPGKMESTAKKDIDEFFENFQQQIQVKFLNFEDSANECGQQVKQCLTKVFEIEAYQKPNSNLSTQKSSPLMNGSKKQSNQSRSISPLNELKSTHKQTSIKIQQTCTESSPTALEYSLGKLIKLNPVEQMEPPKFPNIQQRIRSTRTYENPQREIMITQRNHLNEEDNIFKIRDHKLERQRVLSHTRYSSNTLIPMNNPSGSMNHSSSSTNCLNYGNNGVLDGSQSNKDALTNKVGSLNLIAQQSCNNQEEFNISPVITGLNKIEKNFLPIEEDGNSESENNASILEKQPLFFCELQPQKVKNVPQSYRRSRPFKAVPFESLSTNANNCSISSLNGQVATVGKFEESSVFDWSESLSSRLKAQQQEREKQNKEQSMNIPSWNSCQQYIKKEADIPGITNNQQQLTISSDKVLKKKMIKVSKESIFSKIIETNHQQDKLASYRSQNMPFATSTSPPPQDWEELEKQTQPNIALKVMNKGEIKRPTSKFVKREKVQEKQLNEQQENKENRDNNIQQQTIKKQQSYQNPFQSSLNSKKIKEFFEQKVPSRTQNNQLQKDDSRTQQQQQLISQQQQPQFPQQQQQSQQPLLQPQQQKQQQSQQQQQQSSNAQTQKRIGSFYGRKNRAVQEKCTLILNTINNHSINQPVQSNSFKLQRTNNNLSTNSSKPTSISPFNRNNQKIAFQKNSLQCQESFGALYSRLYGVENEQKNSTPLGSMNQCFSSFVN